MSAYCFIFARGGSKGLANKNIKSFCGKPLIAHTIEFAKNIGIFKDVIVSTDSEDIAAVAQKYGASVPFLRPEHLATDDAPERLAWRHAVEFISKKKSDFDTFVSLPCTAPLRTQETVLRCMDMYYKNPQSLILTCSPSHNSPYFNMISIDQNSNASLLCSSTAERRQDAPRSYNISTVAYVCSKDHVMLYDHIFKAPVKAVIADSVECIDIDDIIDFKIASYLYTERENGKLFK